MRSSILFLSLASFVAATRHPAGCAYDNCFWKDKIPQEWKPLATKFCRALVKPPCTSSSAINPGTSTIVQTLPPTTLLETLLPTTIVETTQFTTTLIDSVTITATQVDNTVCSTTETSTFTTDITYPRFTPIPQRRAIDGLAAQDEPEYRRRMKRSTLPNFVTAGCKKAPALEKLKAACKCFLANPAPSSAQPPAAPIKLTKTIGGSTVVQTLPAQTTTVIETLPPQTVVITATDTITATVQSCTSTSTSIVTQGTLSSCGAPAGNYPSPTTGQVTCTQPANAPSGSVNAFHRIEADNSQGTVFEGCIFSGPRSITTPSGGTHQCGASTGTSITGQTDAASKLTGFTYDGSFSPSFNDYFITRIGSTQQSGNSYWGVLNNGVFTTSGGCGAQVRPGDSSLWQWDAFNLQSLLTITPAYAVVASGSSVSLQVTSRSPNGGGSSPYGGARLSNSDGSVSDSNGGITFTAPTQPGCYQYKASAGNQGRSNAFYLNVVPSFPATIG